MANGLEIAPPQTQLKIPYGHPWRGFNNALDVAQIDRSELAEGSRDMVLDNNDRKLRRRGGMTNFGGTGGLLETGITYSTRTFRGVQMGEFRSPSLGPNFDLSLGALWCDEVSSSEAYGVFAYFDPVAGTFRTLCQTADSDFPLNVKPFAFIGGNRMGASAAGLTVPGDRIKHGAGSRGYLDSGEWLYFPGFGTDNGLGIPHRTNKRHPNSSIAAERVERLTPTGLMPPAWMPRIAFANVALGASEQANWLGQDLFYISCLFIREDGAWGPVCEPRPPSDILTSGATNDISPVATVGGYGLVRLSAVAADTARHITWSGIPTPPKGYSHVALVRSPKVNGTTAAAVPELADLRVVAIIPAGQTTYTDTFGNDANLLVDTRVRTDPNSADKTIWPPRARYVAPSDQRVAVAYCRDNPCAIVVTPRGSNATSDEFNDDDESTPSITARAYVAIVTAAASSHGGAGNDGFVYLDLIYRDSTVGNVTNRRSYRLGDYTLERLVDRINSQGAGANDVTDATTRRWHAQLVPGANRAAPATDLRAHGRSTTIGTGFDDDAAWNAAAGSAPAAIVGTNFDPQRVFGPGWPGLLLFSSAALSPRPIFKDLMYFTRGGQGEAANAPDNWSFKNHRFMPGGSGYIQGLAPIPQGWLVPCSNKIAMVRNIRDVTTGADDDYREIVVDHMRGCISPAMASGPGFAVVLTDQGLMAYNELGESLPLSDGLYNPGARNGELAYEISECIKARARDLRQSIGGGSNTTDYFSIAIGEGKIKIGYRSSSSFDRPNRWLEMDFSPGIEQHGLGALIDPQTERPWGWSAPLMPKDDVDPGAGTQNNIAFSAMTLLRGDIAGTTAFKWYGIRDKHVIGAIEGRIDEFDVGTEDNTINVDAFVVGKLDKPGGARFRHRAKQVTVDWKCSDAPCLLEHARSGGAYGPAISLGPSGSNRDSEIVPLTVSQRGPATTSQQNFTDQGTGVRAELWGWELEAEIVDTGAI